MSKTVDERVLEMRFDNSQFESNVKTTMGTLDRLKQALNMDAGVKSAKDLDNAYSNFKGLDGIASGIESLQKRFSTLGIIGMRVIQNLTDTAMNFASKTMSFVGDAIVQGGINRAMNIENAHFMLQGLLHDEEQVQAIMDQASKSVDGTAYSYDAAAKAASMFAASGIQQGEDLEKALAALAGTAATTNSDYESMSMIFTTVAGQGRLMGDQLLQLASRGMNAAATLAKYFREVKGEANITETDIREMVSKGQIDFQTFAEAMNWAFGDQAQQANKTFTGAMANIRAALARTGQGFVSELIAQQSKVVKLFNRIRMSVNDFNSMLKPMQQDFTSFVLEAAKGMRLFLMEVNFKKVSKTFQNGIYTIVNLLKGVGSVIAPIKNAFNDIFPAKTVSQSVNAIMNFSQHLRTLSENFRLSQQDSENLRNTFDGLFTILNYVGQAVKAAASVFGTLVQAFGIVGSAVLEVTGGIGQAIASVSGTTDVFQNVANVINSAILAIANGLADLIRAAAPGIASLTEGFVSLAQVVGGTFFAALSTAANTLKTIFQGIQPDVTNAIDKIKESIADFTGASSKAHPILEALSAAFKTFGKIVSEIGGMVKKVFDGIIQSISQGSFKPLLSILNTAAFATIAKAIKNISDSFGQFTKGSHDILNIFGNLGEKVGENLDMITSSFKAFQASLNAKTLLQIGTAIAILAASLAVLASIKPTQLATGLGAMIVLIEEMARVTEKFVTISAQVNSGKLLSISASLIAMAASILILSSALKKISSLSMEDIAKGLLAIAVVMGELVAASIALSKWGGKVQTSAMGMILFAAAINILASAVKKFADMDTNAMIQGLIGVGAVMAEIAAFTKIAGGTKNMFSIGAGLTLVAAAMNIFAAAVEKFGSMDINTMSQGLLGMAGALAEVTIAMNLMPKNMMSIGAGLLMVSGALTVIQGVVQSFGGMSWEELGRGLVGLAGSLTILAVAMNAMNGTLAGSAAMLVMAAALAVFIPPFMLLSQLSLPQIASGLIALAGAFAILGVAGAVLGPIAPAILAISGALTLLGVAILAVGAGVTMFAAGMATLAASGVAGAMALAGIVNIIAGLVPQIATTIAQGIITFVTTIAEGATQIIEAVVQIGTAICQAFIELAPQIAEAGVTVISSFLDAVNQVVPQAIEVGLNIITSLLDGIAQNIGQITNSAVDIITGFIDGISSRMGDIVQSGIDLIVNFVNGLADGIRNNQDAVVDAGLNLVMALLEAIGTAVEKIGTTALDIIAALVKGLLDGLGDIAKAAVDLVAEFLKNFLPDDFVEAGKNAVKGVIDGITNMIGDAVDAAKELGHKILNGLKGALKEHSPSKATYEMGGWLVEGLTNGVDENTPKAVAAAEALGKKTVTVINGQVQGGVEELGKSLGIAEKDMETFKKSFEESMQAVGVQSGAFAVANQNVKENTTETDKNTESTDKNTKSTKDNTSEVQKKAQALAEAIKAEQQYGDVMNWAGDVVKEYYNQNYKVIDSENGVQKSLATSKQAIMDYAESIYNAKVAAQEATDQSKTNSDAIVSHAQAVAQAFQEVRAELQKTIETQMDIFSKYEEKSDISGKDMLKNMQSQVKGVSKWADNLDALAERGINQGLLQKLAELGPSGAEKVNAFADMTDKELKKANKLYEKSLKLPAEASASIMASYITAGNASGAGFGNEITTAATTLSGMSYQQFQQAGQNAGLGFTSGITGHALYAAAAASGMGTQTLNALMTTLQEHSPSKATEAMGQNLNQGLINGINQMEGVTAAIAKVGEQVIQQFENVLKTDSHKIDVMAGIISNMHEKKPEAVETAGKVATEIVKALKDGLAEDKVKPVAETCIKSITTAFNNSKTEIEQAAKSVTTTIITSLKTELANEKITPIAKTMMESITKGMEANKSAVTQKAQDIAKDILKKFTEVLKESDFKKIGSDAIANLQKGLKSKEAEIIRVSKKMAQDIKKAFSDNLKKEDFKKIGSDAAEGLKEGIDSKIDEISKAAIKAAKAAIKAAKKELKEHSPSRVFHEIGEYVDQGMIDGIVEFTDNVAKAGRNMAKETIKSVNEAVEFYSMDDIDFNPAITPVIDLTEYRNGMNQIDDVMANRSIQLSAGLRGIDTSRMDMIDALGERLGRIQMTGTDTVATAINELRGDVETLTRQMTNLQVVMDTGTLVGAISPEMDMRLGMMETYKGRGI